MNIRSGPASVVSAEPILFPLPLCLLPRLQGFADVPDESLLLLFHPCVFYLLFFKKYSYLPSLLKLTTGSLGVNSTFS